MPPTPVTPCHMGNRGNHLEKWKNVVLMDIIDSLIKTGNKTANINVKTAVYTHC